MTLLCSRCGRSLKASAIPEQQPGVSQYAALGPVCAKRVGLTVHARRRPFVAMRRRRAADARQMELPA